MLDNFAPTISTTSLFGSFSNCNIVNSIGTGWDVSNVQNFSKMFAGAVDFNSSEVVNWDTSSATNMFQMFYFNTDFNQDISGWNFANVANIGAFLLSSNAFSTANYNALLVQIEDTNKKTGLSFHGGDATHTGAGTTARNLLTSRSPAWSITDGGAG